MKFAGLLPGPDLHHLDHLAPLCSFLEIPLVLTNEKIYELARLYYPALHLSFLSPLEMPLSFLELYDCAITCLPRALIDELFFIPQTILNRHLHTIWCPHGNSDKGWSTPFMEGLREEELLLVYGNRMRMFLKVKGVDVPTLSIGNYRLLYYQRHFDFYNSILPPSAHTTLLYAPTWQDLEQSSSLEGISLYLLKNIPQNTHLIVKPHPHLQLQNPRLLDRLKDSFQVLEDFPPVYPLLNQAALYIGDMSSIGYDFLSFKRPMLFLNPNQRDPQTDPGLYLSQCGSVLFPHDYSNLYPRIASLLQNHQLKEKQEEVYGETFDVDTIYSVKEHLNALKNA